MSEKVLIGISKDLYERIKRFVEAQGGFSSVEEFVEFVLRELVESEEVGGLSKEDEEKVRERLRALGYL